MAARVDAARCQARQCSEPTDRRRSDRAIMRAFAATHAAGRAAMKRRHAISLALLPVLPGTLLAADGDGLFSTAAPGSIPKGWAKVPINDSKTPTDYAIVRDGDQVVLRAQAKSSASMFMREAAIDLSRTPILRWRWKLGKLPAGADNSVASKEDSAARLVLTFDGDRASLPFFERTKMGVADSLSGQVMPYATLMYVTSSVAAAGQRIANPHTNRVQMVVAAKAEDALGKWQSLERDVEADFKAAFGEAPKKVIAYGVMSDTDNTGGEAEAWYGDISFAPRR
jgi:hypothetical protein